MSRSSGKSRQYAPLSAGDNLDDDTLIQLQPTTSMTAPAAPTRSSNTHDRSYQDLANGEGSPAYHVLTSLLTDEYRKQHAGQLNIIPSNSSRGSNLCTGSLCCCLGVRTFQVADGCVRLAEDGSGKFLIYGPGVHRVINPFLSLKHRDQNLMNPVIKHGDRTICTVSQGQIGYCEDRGLPVLLPPGLHEWRSSTMNFVNSVDLNNTLIPLGPYTVLTVDEGYSAITQNSGKMIILKGGATHLLTHRNWKFEKFMTEKIQTNDLQRIEATSADNVKMHTQATVVWRVSDVEDAARMSAETMRTDGGEVTNLKGRQSNIDKLQNDVLKQATASLAAFIGEVRYSDTFHVSAAQSNDVVTATGVAGGAGAGAGASAPPDYSPIWDSNRMSSALAAANKVTKSYGVTILSINIISAVPADDTLQNALAAGAVASAEAEQAETIARGKARAVRIMAEGDAMAETIRAEGAYTAGEKLGSSAVAVELARLDKIGHVLGERTSFFFGADPSQLGSIMSNPKLVK